LISFKIWADPRETDPRETATFSNLKAAPRASPRDSKSAEEVAANKQEEEEVVIGRMEIMEQPMGFIVQGIAGITTKALQQFGMNSNSSN
jgi:hypothetical protein